MVQNFLDTSFSREQGLADRLAASFNGTYQEDFELGEQLESSMSREPRRRRLVSGIERCPLS